MTNYWLLDFQPPSSYLGDDEMLLILDRGHSVPTVTELIFVRALFRKVQNAFVAKLVEHCALTGGIGSISFPSRHMFIEIVYYGAYLIIRVQWG
jgi:hypothetical protein